MKGLGSLGGYQIEVNIESGEVLWAAQLLAVAGPQLAVAADGAIYSQF